MSQNQSDKSDRGFQRDFEQPVSTGTQRSAVWDGSQPVFSLLLPDAGYYIGETYKVWSPGSPNDAPFGAGKHAYEKAGGRFNQFSQNVTKMVTEGRSTDAAKQSLYDEVLGNFNAFLAARPADRAIRTLDSLYIVNFKPDRWPLGDPYRLDGDNPPTAEELAEETRVSLPDEDAGPAKAWLVGVRNDPKWKTHFDWGYGKRPREELYDFRVDPQQTKNVAADLLYAESRGELEKRLMDELRRTGDPRLVDEGKFFETPPLAGPVQEEEVPKKKTLGSNNLSSGYLFA